MTEAMELPSTAIARVDAMKAVQVFAPGGVKGILDALEQEAKRKRFDVSTPEGRDACRSYAYKIARSKTALDTMGKDLTEDWRKRTSAVNEERRLIRERLDALAADVRAPLTTFEDAERERISGHEAAIAEILAATKFDTEPTPAQVEARMDHVLGLPDRDWREFAQRATEAKGEVLDRLAGTLALAEKRQKAAAEAARLRAEQEEQQRQEAARLQAEREERIAAQAAERVRLEAERRAAEERSFAAAREREAALALGRAEQAAREAAAQAERDRVSAAEAAERRRVAEAAAAERRQQEAILDERRRAAEERAQQEAARQAEEAEAKRRAANRSHKAKINNAAVSALILLGVAEEVGKRIVEAIARGDVPSVSIRY